MVQALIDGRLVDTVDLWNTADTLRISLQGPYTVVCAELSSVGRSVLPGIENRLAARGISSAWRLQPDIEIGILHLGPNKTTDPVIEELSKHTATRIGISPPIADLGQTAGALRYARIAMTASRPEHGPITVFDRDVMAITAVAAPEVMGRVAANVLGPLDELPEHEREALLDTLEAWFDHGGSAERAAQELYVHPNTVRQRLRKIEQRTGRSVSEPRAAAELCIALETTRRAARPDR